ncbi:MAG TPA: DUF5009 domain-containing protein [Longimicrobiales bacterium]|nr:DUF5009 domain-containing protein [Longimicrobiales bacterium]
MTDILETTPRPAAVGAPSALPTAPAGPRRLLSLDVFRGITIASMVLVNNPGDWGHIYAPLEHAKWNGWTPTDLIFPFFVYIVGVAMTFSFGKLVERGASKPDLFFKVLKRAAIIFGLSLAIQGFPAYDFSHIRVMGVLQRIAVAYLAASMIYLNTRTWKARAGWTAGLLLLYWALMLLVPVPGIGAGWLEPGKNLSAWIDYHVLTPPHMWAESKTWDPEGLLSTIPAIATCLLGVLTGEWLRAKRSAEEKVIGLFVAGTLGLALGLIWGGAFPINKSIWTSSYVVFTGGFAAVCLALCYWTVDVKGWRGWTKPFVVYGVNALALYVLSAFVGRLIIFVIKVPTATGPVALKTWLYTHLFAPFFSPINASLAWALAYVLVWLGAMWVLYRQRIFIKV